ncbi:hypothetical protein B296_00000291 [Ensete ventricosum]|uniref:Uncharacterized protein n=1 Tax=Ensete ventricosum TaxID=4639 RepID=A0A426ZNZ8_ENSVE|nr:hypothetical protein B296_00000291 [Ensete ventricosum]
MVSRKNTIVIKFAQSHAKSRKVEFRSIFHASSQKFKILTIPNVLAHGKLYEHGFTKKCDSHKPCTKAGKVEFRLVFRALSQKFKILVIPNVLAHGKSYEHGFMKKCDDHKLCKKLCRVEF